VLGLVFFALVGGGFLVARLALGPLAIDGFAPQIAKALDDRFGHRYEFGFGGTAIVRNGYAPALSIDKLSIKEPSGRMILTAPRAEVSVDLLALSVGRVTPRRLEIFDVEVHLTLRPDGSLALPVASNSGEAVALTPPLASALAPDSPLLPADAGTKDPAAQTLTAKPPRALIVKQMAASIRLVIDTLTNPASPAAAIDRVGITRGKIVIDDETANQTMVFNGVNLSFDKSSGATRFDLSVEGPNGRWLASGVAGGMPGSERGLMLSFSNLSLDEILLATGTRTIGADFDMPLSGKLSVRLQADGMLSEAAGQFEFGAGYLRFDDPDDEPLMIDKVTGGFHWNPAARRISVDPDDRVLKNSSDVRLRASILRGQGLIQQGDLAGALLEFSKALEVNKNSSLAHYRVAEVFFLQRNYQAAANAYRESLNGDGEPRWTEVWSHIQLGKIFDVTGQRERATNEYRQALQTNDNTQGAQEEARKYLQKPFEQQKNSQQGQEGLIRPAQ
jgi:predicted negative regulator of RcsB-dependent stress response